MSMGDVFAFFGALLVLGIALPGMLLAWSLLFPTLVERAQLRLARTPWRCFWLGCAAMIVSVVVIGALMRIPAGPSQMLGWLMVGVLLSMVGLGASGLAGVMGERLRGRGMPVSAPSALLRGALSLEMAAVFPLIGWFIVIPVTTLVSLGAAAFAFLNRQPRQSKPQPATAYTSQQPTCIPTEKSAHAAASYQPFQPYQHQPLTPAYIASSPQEYTDAGHTTTNPHTP